MTRTTKYRLGWLAVLLALVGAAAVVLTRTGVRPMAMILVALVLFAPGRLQGHLWRDFFRGTRLLRAGRNAEALPYLERFRSHVAAQPSLKRAIWLSWPGYSADVEVMTLTNLGAAHFGLGDLDAAERHLREASARDPLSPLPWVNLALVAGARSDQARAAEYATEARRLGYRGDLLDRAQMAVAGALAHVEGRGVPTSGAPG